MIIQKMLHLGKAEYIAFLKTDFWLDLSSAKKESVGNCCAMCGRTENLQCHHRFYRQSWFDTRITDLIVLCAQCHKQIHNALGKPPTMNKRLRPHVKRQHSKIRCQNYRHGFRRDSSDTAMCRIQIHY